MSKNVIIVDADYVDKTTFDLTVNFERMIGRQIPKADMARWVDCVALDGGIRQGENEILVILIHDKEQTGLKNFTPSLYETELNGQAFKDHLGEFTFEAYPVETMTTKNDFVVDILQTVSQQKDVERIMVVADDSMFHQVRTVLLQTDGLEKHITVFTMQPQAGGHLCQEILGYSLMAALGIRSEEIHCE